ncbi:MAG: VOC family protein [Solirubrobacterales bacterium]|nr:VOC family protein [Solirubrobacterales bacterium]
MTANRSAPAGPVIPVLTYPDVRQAVDWLVDVLGFVERVWIGPDHRAQLSFGEGSLIVADATRERVVPTSGEVTQSVMLRVDDVAVLCARARDRGATVVAEPEDFEYGERQCALVDPGGHRWTLTQTLRDVEPEEWGGATPAP